MAGIYLHTPFCKKKCNYCDFYSDTKIKNIKAVIDSEIKELELKKNYLKHECIESIYLGGGTPSLLKINFIKALLEAINKNYLINNDCEITFECNPDDITRNYLSELKQSGINRISMGVQSFNNNALKFLGRRHSAEQAENAIITTLNEGFKNVSVDLIFGIPGLSFDNYVISLQTAVNFHIQHISAYQLTYEENTLLHKRLFNNEFTEVKEDIIIEQFDYTIDFLTRNGFRQYEVSNYAREGFMSRHNWLYWNNGKYLGVGPSAHSYDGKSRQWNNSDNLKYIWQINSGEHYYQIEILSEIDMYNEYILTGLRTSKGISLNYIRKCFNKNLSAHFSNIIKDFVEDSLINKTGDNYIISTRGINILDFIIKKLSYI